MSPLLLLVSITVGLIAYMVVSGWVGHRLGRALCHARHHGAKTRVVRFTTSYIPWSLLAGVLICVIVLGSASGPLVPVVTFGPFLVSLFVADSLEPTAKKCKTCGR